MFRRRKQFRRGPRAVTRWAGNYANFQLTRTADNFDLSDGAVITSTIVGVEDYNIASDGLLELKGGTVVRIRGSIDWNLHMATNDANRTMFWNVAMGIIATREDVGIDLFPNPGNVTQFVQSNWLWLEHRFGTEIWLTDNISGNLIPTNKHIDVDVRAKRKLDDENLVLCVAVGTTGVGNEGDVTNFNFSMALRALLKGM